MQYVKTNDPCAKRSEFLGFRASTNDRQRVEALKSLLKVSSTSDVFRSLVNEKADKLGLG